MDKLDQAFGTVTDEPSVVEARREADVIDAQHVERAEENHTPMSSLACWVMARFKENEDARRRSGVSDALDYCQTSNKCEFTEEQRDRMAAALGPAVAKRVFVPITTTKVRAARALLIDLANQSGDPLFRIEPSPVPTVPDEVAAEALGKVEAEIGSLFSSFRDAGIDEVPPEAMDRIRQSVVDLTESSYDSIMNQEESYAKNRASRMQAKVEDVLAEGGWGRAFEKYVDDVCTFGTGVIVGPVVRNVAKNECVTDRKTGVVKYRRTVKAVPCFESVSPQDCYPAPDAKDVTDGPLCIVARYVGDDLSRMAKSSSRALGDGWIADNVRLLMAHHPRGGVKVDVKTYDTERRWCENNGYCDTNDCMFEGVRCFASVRGSELLDMGISRSRNFRTIEADSFYKTETVVIENRVVYCRIYQDELDLPVSKGVFYTIPGSWWGDSIAAKVAMCQTVLNNCIKAMLRNMASSSEPIWWINDVQRMANKAPDALKIRAGMTIPFMTSLVGNTGAPVGAISVPSNASELLSIWNNMQTQADTDSGIPRYAEGQSAGQSGALRTSGGLAQFTEHMMRSMKMVMTSTDTGVITPVARKTADWILLNDSDMDAKGDVDIMPVGLVGKAMKIQRDQQRLQLLQMVLNSQILTQTVGVKGIVAMLRPSLSDTDINPDDVLPTKERMDAIESVEEIKRVFAATQASQGVHQAAVETQAMEQANGVPQPEIPQAVQGGVAERRAVA